MTDDTIGKSEYCATVILAAFIGSKIVKYVANHPRIYSLTGFGATLSSLTKEEIEALEDAFKLRFFSSGSRRNMTIFTFVNGEYIEKPVVRAVPLEHTCPPECYRIHLTTPDPEGEAI